MGLAKGEGNIKYVRKSKKVIERKFAKLPSRRYKSLEVLLVIVEK